MKKRLLRLPALLFTLLFLTLTGPGRSSGAAAAGDPAPYVRIGLSWGSGAVSSASVKNETGSGFDFGYFDSSRSFVSLCGTEKTAVSVLKDWNMTWSSSARRYDTGTSGSRTVGCYHILLGTCNSRKDAEKLCSGCSDGYTAYIDGAWCACAGSYTSETAAKDGMKTRGLSGSVISGSDRCVAVVETDTGRILFEYDNPNGYPLGIMPRNAGGAAVTSVDGTAYYGGFQFERISGGNLTVVNYVRMEDYTAGVVPCEMGESWPMEALKAQAVAVRSYAAANQNRHKSYGFDLCDGDDCQKYEGVKDAPNCGKAVRDTAGVYMTYAGDYAKAFYYSCNGGMTENSENVYYEEIPYLRSKADPYEGSVETGWESWTFTYTATEITDILNAKGYRIAKLVGITPRYTSAGNIESLTFTDVNGKDWTFERGEAGSILTSYSYRKYTYSQRFTIQDASGAQQPAEYRVNSSNNRLDGASTVYAIGGSGEKQRMDLSGGVTVITGSGIVKNAAGGGSDMIRASEYRVTGSGFGHNVGMSQFGAMAMAKQGYTYQDILNFYYTGVKIG